MKKVGNQTIKFDNPPTILETASIVGPKEAETIAAPDPVTVH